MPANVENSAVATGLERVNFYSNPKGNQPSIFIGQTDAEVEAVILWSPNVKSLLIGKAPHVGKD